MRSGGDGGTQGSREMAEFAVSLQATSLALHKTALGGRERRRLVIPLWFSESAAPYRVGNQTP